ncbi:hypothetical protein BDC45DRAFT_576838 [Circinella umbellata]|nr:hypothetical protein BDC45DRAFT_576838 [Circinella umbellata]
MPYENPYITFFKKDIQMGIILQIATELDVYLGIDKKDHEPQGFEAAPSLIRKAKALATGVLDKEGTLTESDLFADFEELEEEYLQFFTSGNITSSSFIITFRAPLMIKYTNFRVFLCVTDVTYSAFQKARYLCSTVMYFPKIRKHALIFQAVIGGLTTEYFHQYFLTLFLLYKIDFSSTDNFMGMVMDFSLA